jgi:hypothetical protein
MRRVYRLRIYLSVREFNPDNALARGVNLWSLDLMDLCGSFGYHPLGDELTHPIQ